MTTKAAFAYPLSHDGQGKIEPGSESSIPVIGSDIFSTVLDILEIPQPGDRTIDGVSIVPTFSGQKLQRKVPLFWRTHIAPEPSHAAMRIENWKLVVNSDLTKFQLYEIEKDWQEKNDLAEAEPQKLQEMKSKFMEVWKGVETEGPSEWWKNAPPPGRRKPQKGKKLAKGKDETGDWDIVRGGTVSSSDLGYRLNAGAGEAFALNKLDQPIQEEATFRLSYRTATDANTKNACFCFGSVAENNTLLKAGTMMGLSQHGVFEGSWGNVGIGSSTKDQFKPEDTFEAEVTIDLEHGIVKLTVGNSEVKHPLPDGLEQVTHVGIYAKATVSDFSRPIECKR